MARSASPKTRLKPRPLTPERIVGLLDDAYGTTPWRPHGEPIAELVLTLLSQNTSDSNSGRAYIRLLNAFPNWHSLLDADVKEIEEAIRPGGLAPTKAPRLQALLREVWARRAQTGPDGPPSGGALPGESFDLSFLRDLPQDEARAWLRSLPAVGPKTAACVLLFGLGIPALPVDTHVHRVAIRLGLVPEKTTAEQAHVLLESMVDPEFVYPFHVQLIKHGRRTCSARKPKCSVCPLRAECPSAAEFTS